MIFIYIFVYLCILCYLEKILKINKKIIIVLCTVPLISLIVFF